MPSLQLRAVGQSRREDKLTRTYPYAEAPTALRKLAFAALWLLVFAIPWEDAIWLPEYGTATRLIGMLAAGLGILAFIEKGRIKFPSPAHILMILFTIWASISYLWSADPASTAEQASTYRQLLIMVWLIWEFCSHNREQERLMQAYV